MGAGTVSRKLIKQSLLFDMPLVKTDVALVFGTPKQNEPAGTFTADLYHRGVFPKIIVSGGKQAHDDHRREFEVAADALLKNGVPESAIKHESCAEHTSENIEFSLPLGLNMAQSITLICLQPHQLRVLMTARKVLGNGPVLTTAYYEPKNFGPLTWPSGRAYEQFTQLEYKKTVSPCDGQPAEYVALGYCVPIDLEWERQRALRLPAIGYGS